MSAMASQITSLTIVYSIVYLMRKSKKTSKLRVTGLCVGNSPGIGECPAQRASNAENVSIWWRHQAKRDKSFCLTNLVTRRALSCFFRSCAIYRHFFIQSKTSYYLAKQKQNKPSTIISAVIGWRVVSTHGPFISNYRNIVTYILWFSESITLTHDKCYLG